MNYYRLEYNEKTGGFHFEDNKLHPENLMGWRTISRGVSENICMRFVEKIEKKYSDKLPSFEIIQEEFFNNNIEAPSGSSLARGSF